MFTLTNPFQADLSLSDLRVFCLFTTFSISIICVSQDKPSLIASNQQIHDFFKLMIFEKKRHCGK